MKETIDWNRIHLLDFLTHNGWVIPVVIAVLTILVFAWSLVWVYGDAEHRGKSGCLVLLLIVILGWPLALVAWLVFRPETPRRRRK
jgi:hypothetical protein